MASSKKYDIILFGVTGFTGTLAAEYLLNAKQDSGLKWAVSARNASKAEEVLQKLVGNDAKMPDILVADLVCQTPEDKAKLQAIVEQTKVVLTCSGPFEKYGPTLVELCAQTGVYYADITGETDYVRQTIEKHDAQAQKSGAVLLSHCGHDCIPCDLMVWEMNQFASNQGCRLTQVLTYQEFADEAAFSGGTAATAAYQLSKDRSNKPKTEFDPLLMTVRKADRQQEDNVIPPRHLSNHLLCIFRSFVCLIAQRRKVRVFHHKYLPKIRCGCTSIAGAKGGTVDHGACQ